MRTETELRIGTRVLKVSNLGKVLYPKVNFTKGHVIDYYIRISEFLLPHLKNRPLTLKRYPNGVEGQFFYEKRCPSHRPDWVKTAPIWSQGNQENIDFCLANDLPTLIWAANLADLELHTSLSVSRNSDRPTVMVYDLDPGPPADILDCARIGLRIKSVFEDLGLQSYPKTTGSKGLQLYVPLNTAATYEDTKDLARAIAEELERKHPEEVVSKMQKSLRKGKVLIDWSQNDRHKTTVCVYSLRAKDQPNVSAPVTWEEVSSALKKKDAQCLSFLSDEVVRRCQEMGDLFLPVLKQKQKLPTWSAEQVGELVAKEAEKESGRRKNSGRKKKETVEV